MKSYVPKKSRKDRTRDSTTNSINVGSDYDDEEKEFLRTVDAFRTKKGKKFLLATDYLKVLKSLGWERKGDDDVGTGTADRAGED